jgi:helicase
LVLQIGDKPLHVLGLGHPELVSEIFSCGVQSVDSTSYVKLAADGRRWGSDGLLIKDAAPIERLHLALCNLAIATQAALPLSAARFFFSVTSNHLDGVSAGE